MEDLLLFASNKKNGKNTKQYSSQIIVMVYLILERLYYAIKQK